MDTHVLIPVKRLDGAKSRLAEALDADGRADLVRELLEHVLAVVKEADVGPVTVVSAEPLELNGVPRFDDRGLPWNEALSAAMTEVVSEPVVAVVAADLPRLTADEVRALVWRRRSAGSPSPARRTAARTPSPCARPAR